MAPVEIEMERPPVESAAAGTTSGKQAARSISQNHKQIASSRRRKLRLPAFGRYWLARRLAGESPTGAMLLTRTWPKQPAPRWTVIVPADADPADYDLSIVAGLGVIVSVGATDNANAVLISMVEAARPALAVVLFDGVFLRWIPK
jgi:hypothetical protein